MRNRSTSKNGTSRLKVSDCETLGFQPPRTRIGAMKNKLAIRSSNKNVTIAIAFALIYVAYWYWTKDEFMTPEKIAEWSANKTIIITGANSVVSVGVLQHLIRANTAQHIIMACRSLEKCQATMNQVKERVGETKASPRQTAISIVQLDLASRTSIQACAHVIQSSTTLSTSTGSALPNNTILVWNANDSTHDPVGVNAWGHLYLSHLLYPQLQRIVVAASIVGGWPWNVLQPWDERVNRYPSWLQGIAQYGTSKRALLLLAQELQQRQSPRGVQVMVTQAALTCDVTEPCSVISMTPEKGAHSHLRAMLDPGLSSGTYLGHRWVLWGKTVIAGSLTQSWYHWPLSRDTQSKLWAWSMKELGINEFGIQSTAQMVS